MGHLVTIQHGLHGKFYIASVACKSTNSHFMQMRRRVHAAIDITVDNSPIAQLIFGLLDFNGG